MMTRTVHVIGAGLAGLAAALSLSRGAVKVVLHEAQGQAGGRCRSYYDHATGLTIDNGNHLLLSGNHAALAYVRELGTQSGFGGPSRAEFCFADLMTGKRWTLRINDGVLPWWIFDRRRRAPETRLRDYLAFARLLWPRRGATIGDLVPCAGPLYRRLLRPLMLAALNVDPREGSAALGAAVLRETLAVGGKACRPLVARAGLSSVLVEPALQLLRARGVTLMFNHELRALSASKYEIAALDFGHDRVSLSSADAVILAVPAAAAAALVPDLTAPTEFRAIVNAHFRVEPPADFPVILGVVNGLTEWIFSFPERFSVTISAADRLLGEPRERLAEMIWREVALLAGLDAKLPPWQIVRERRATFAATPAQDARRPPAQTTWRNLFLAGDWTQTGLPATIEGAIRSGNRAAELALAR
jgi:squalene-associated FAD-dependent desaturase